jgi:ribosome-binding factor A
MADFSQRQFQVGEQIKRTLADLFIRGEFDSRLSKGVTVTEVKVASGLKYAEIYVICKDTIETENRVQLLNNNIKRIKKSLATNLKIRFMPEIVFKEDKSLDFVDRIEEILNSPDVKKDLQ